MKKSKKFDNGMTSNGYVLVYQPEHPASSYDGYVKEHRLVIEKSIGRYIAGTEVIHHINGKKADNRLENLQLLKSETEHKRIHAGWELRDGKWFRLCSGCNRMLELNEANFYFRKKNTSNGSLISKCKECNRKLMEEYNRTHRKERCLASKKWALENPDKRKANIAKQNKKRSEKRRRIRDAKKGL